MTNHDGGMSRNSHKLFATVFFITILVALRPIYDAFTPNIFTDRDLARAEDLSATLVNWLGPELSNSALNLGPFSYLLTSIPLFLFGPDGYFWSLIIFLALGVTILFWTLAKSDDPDAAALIVTLVGASPIVFTTVRMAWNPSVLPFFWILIFVSLASRKVSALAIGLLIGLSTQIHILSIVWLPIAFLTFGWTLKKSILGVCLGFATPQIPAIFRASPVELEQSSATASRVLDLTSWLELSRIQTMLANTWDFIGLSILIAFGLTITKTRTPAESRRLVFAWFALVVSLVLAQRSLEKRVQLHYLGPSLIAVVYIIKSNWNGIHLSRTRLYATAAVLFAIAFGANAHSAPILQVPWLAFITISIGAIVLGLTRRRELILPYTFSNLTIALFIQLFSDDVIQESRFVSLVHAKAITQVIHEKTEWSRAQFEKNSLVYLRWPENSLWASYPDVPEGSREDLQVIVIDRRLEAALKGRTSFWSLWIQEKKLSLDHEESVGPYSVRIYRKSDRQLPSSVHNIQTPTKDLKNPLEDRFRAAFTSRILGNEAIEISVSKNTLRLTSPLLSRYQTKGPQMQIVDSVLTYTCGAENRTIEIPKTGIPPFRPPGLRSPVAYVRAGMTDYMLAPVEWTLEECVAPIIPKSIFVRLAHLQIWDETNSDQTKEVMTNLTADFATAASMEVK